MKPLQRPKVISSWTGGDRACSASAFASSLDDPVASGKMPNGSINTLVRLGLFLEAA